MERRPLDEPTLHKVVHDMVRHFAAAGDAPVETESGEIVSVRMDHRFHVTSVSISGIKMGPANSARLEAAVMDAVNSAIREVARPNPERLTAMAPDMFVGIPGSFEQAT